MKILKTSSITEDFNFSKSFEKNEYLILTNKNNAIGIISAFPDDLFKHGFIQWFAIKAFKNGDLTLRQLAGLLKRNVEQIIDFLNTFNIPIIDYKNNF